LAYSCTDFFDDVMRCLVESHAITEAEIPADNPGKAADVAIAAIVTMSRAGLSSLFLRELLNEAETLAAGTGALAFLFYLQAAILNDSFVLTHGDDDSKVVALVGRLPSAFLWTRHIRTGSACF
jgi:hypothetical protein